MSEQNVKDKNGPGKKISFLFDLFMSMMTQG